MILPDFPTKIFDFPVRKLLVYQKVPILGPFVFHLTFDVKDYKPQRPLWDTYQAVSPSFCVAW
jgi:hypothetical protein